MSLKDLNDVLGERKRNEEHYEPGMLPYDSVLVQKLLENAQDLRLGIHNEVTESIREYVPKQLEYVQNFDHNAFLDALLMGWRMSPGKNFSGLGHLTRISIQTLYDAGLNDFSLDFTGFATSKNHNSLFNCIVGEEGNPLRIRSTGGSFAIVGWRMAHVNLDFSGYAQLIGEHAEHSLVIVHECENAEYNVGSNANDSTFYCHHLKNLPFTNFEQYCFDEGALPYLTSSSCTYHVEVSDERVTREIERNGFWKHGNVLKVRDGDDWEEVTP